MATDKLVDFDHVTDYISREAALDFHIQTYDLNISVQDQRILGDRFEEFLKSIPAADVRPVPDGGIGEMSDGYHTFNGLYYQRVVLFAALVKQNKDSAWKSHRHEDGELCFGGGWFIVGIDTPKGSYTYHYEDKDWDLFDCEELPVGKHWDGHTEDDVTRLLSLPEMRPVVRGRWIPTGKYDYYYKCSVCNEIGPLEPGGESAFKYNFCSNCGADMREVSEDG